MKLITALVLMLVIIYGLISLYWWITSRVYKKLKRRSGLAGLILFPGVFVHEFSHLLMALVTWRKVTSVSFYNVDHEQSGELGHVRYSYPSKRLIISPLVNMVIALAPIIGASAVMYVATCYLLSSHSFDALAVGLVKLWSNFSVFEVGYWRYLAEVLVSAASSISLVPANIFLLYLVISISHGAVPSSTDMKLAAKGLQILILVVLLCGLYAPIGSVLLTLLPVMLTAVVTLFMVLGVPIILLWLCFELAGQVMCLARHR